MSQGQGQQQSTQQNSSDVLLIPFAKLADGVWNLPDNVIAGIWNKVVEQKLLGKVFYDGSVNNASEFVQMMKAECNLPAILYNGELLGFAWLNDMGQSKAFAHFCMFKESYGKHTQEMGNKLLDYWFSLENEQGEKIFKVLIGNTPPWNRAALSYIKKLGFTVIGEIPHVGQVSYIESEHYGQQKTEGRLSIEDAGADSQTTL